MISDKTAEIAAEFVSCYRRLLSSEDPMEGTDMLFSSVEACFLSTEPDFRLLLKEYLLIAIGRVGLEMYEDIEDYLQENDDGENESL